MMMSGEGENLTLTYSVGLFHRTIIGMMREQGEGTFSDHENTTGTVIYPNMTCPPLSITVSDKRWGEGENNIDLPTSDASVYSCIDALYSQPPCQIKLMELKFNICCMSRDDYFILCACCFCMYGSLFKIAWLIFYTCTCNSLHMY